MAVAPLQLPGYAAPQSPDFTQLANLGQVYKQANQDATRQQTLAQLGQGDKIDPRALLASGDLSLANLGVTLQNQQTQGERDARDFAFRQEEAKRAQQNADRSYGLQARAAARADEGPLEKASQRAKAAEQFGLTPGTPEHKTYVLTGELPKGTSIPAGFQLDTAGGLKPIPGGPADPAYLRTKGDKQNAPSGYRWIDPENPNAGMVAIPGGPGEKVDAEVAGRLGLAKSFLGQLPDIRKRVEAGEITGPIDAAQAYAGMGGPGEIRRQIDSGAESLLRMLTGAGMIKDEAKNYVRRYQFSPTDTSTTVLSKLNQLERELNSVGETVGKGRGGWSPPAASPAKQTQGITQQQYEALPSGSTFTAPDGTTRVKP